MSEEFNNMNEEKEVERIEISLSDEEINEWIVQLATLKVTKGNIQMDLDEENELSINYEEEEEEESA